MSTPETTTMFVIFFRYREEGSTEWHPQQSTQDEGQARQWLRANREYDGDSREYILTKQTNSYERIEV